MAEQPNSISRDIMGRIHGSDIYAGYRPGFVLDRQGWNSRHTAFTEIIAGLRPGVIIDVGVWKGDSTIHLAELMRGNRIEGAVIAVDTFLGSVEHWDRRSGFAGLMPFRHGMPLLYEQFLSNVVLCGVQDLVVPLPQTSAGAGSLLVRLGIRAGMIHLDASHDYEDVLRDARLYWELLTPGGFLVGDDYNQDWPSVVRAADAFAAEKGLSLMASHPKWIVRKPI